MQRLFLLLHLLLYNFICFANEEGPLRVVLERDSSSGIEQAAIIFLENSVQVTANSNFFANDDKSFYLGKFQIPMNKDLYNLKIILQADYLELSKQKEIIDQLGAKEQLKPNPHREYIYINTLNTITNQRLERGWKKKLGAVFNMLEPSHAKDAIVVKIVKDQLFVTDLKTKKSSKKVCNQRVCILENYGKVMK